MTAGKYGQKYVFILRLSENDVVPLQAEGFGVFTEFNGAVRQASVPLLPQLRPRHAEC